MRPAPRRGLEERRPYTSADVKRGTHLEDLTQNFANVKISEFVTLNCLGDAQVCGIHESWDLQR